MKPFFFPFLVFLALVAGIAISESSGSLVNPSSDIQCSLCPEKLAACAMELANPRVKYDGSYQKLTYPMGDVDPDIGVCTDVIIRALRCSGIDLQVEVYKHRKKKNLPTDTNIDHRRVPNIAAYLEDNPKWDVISAPSEFQPGDIIWNKLGPDQLNHIGIFVNTRRYMHNCGHGQNADGKPHDWPIVKVFRLSSGAQ